MLVLLALLACDTEAIGDEDPAMVVSVDGAEAWSCTQEEMLATDTVFETDEHLVVQCPSEDGRYAGVFARMSVWEDAPITDVGHTDVREEYITVTDHWLMWDDELLVFSGWVLGEGEETGTEYELEWSAETAL